MTDRTLTCSGNLFQGVCICVHAGIASCDNMSRMESLDFHAEPIPIHSPLLREYYLVSFPPITYMLKFSRFSGLTSCIGMKKTAAHWGAFITRNTTPEEDVQRCACPAPPRHMCQCNECCMSDTPRRKTKDTEENVLSIITRKSNMRLTFYWCTESCNSQCLSHFAAPFIVV